MHAVETMIYEGQRPWHGLGIDLSRLNGITTRQAIEADPRIGSNVNAVPLLAHLANGLTVPVPDQYAMVREYDNKVVGVVGEQFKKSDLQPSRMFEFFDNILGEGQARIHTAGTLHEGKKIWILAKLSGDDIRVLGTDDLIEKYLLLCTAFDGSMPLTAFFTPTRVVCQNTLNGALRGEKYNQVKIRHTVNAQVNLKEAERTLKASIEFYNKFEEKVQVLATKQLTEFQVELALRRMFGQPDESKIEDIPSRTLNNMDKVAELAVDGKGNAQWAGTAWGLLQGATEYADHYMVVRGARGAEGVSDNTQAKDKIMNSVWMGAAAQFKADAFSAVDSILGL